MFAPPTYTAAMSYLDRARRAARLAAKAAEESERQRHWAEEKHCLTHALKLLQP